MTVTTTKVDQLDQLHRRLSNEVLGLVGGAEDAGHARRRQPVPPLQRTQHLPHFVPSATRVAVFQRWRSLGRHVRRGA